MPGTSSSTSPSSSASAGVNRFPDSSTFSSPAVIPRRRTTRTTPPQAGSSPSPTSGRPSSLPGTSATIRWWLASASSRPPPSAAPLIAATTGVPRISIARSCALMPFRCVVNRAASSACRPSSSFRSPPAKNVFFAEVSTTPVMCSRSCFSRATVSPSAVTNRSDIVLADWAGSSMVRTTMPSLSVCQRMISVSVMAGTGSSGSQIGASSG